MDQVDEVKSKIDIVEVISSYIPLKKAGRNLSGLCPFHGEKTPSFMVSPERQAFKCFGCGEGGDVYTFLEKIEGWEFRETLEELAKRAGVKLRDFKPSGASRDREKLLEINKLAAKFFKYILQKHNAGESGRKYLKSRGIGEDLWDKFDLGFAPDGWENVSKFLTKRGFNLADVVTAGLIIGRESRSGSGHYDRFRNRLMFPIKDSRGSVVGFSGRILDPNAREAKYVNSPQTPIFNKGSLLFGLDLARKDIREKNEAVLVEGEFDVLSSCKAGVPNTVASKGTALTDQQVAILSRLCDRVALCFDTDLAGDAASRRGIELMDMAGINVKVVELDKYKDPDEFAQKDAAGYRKAIKSAIDIYDYFIDSASRRFDAGSADGKKKIGREVIPVLSKISDDLVRAHYVSKLAKLLDLDVQLVAEAVAKKTDVSGTGTVVPGDDKVAQPKLSREEYFLALLVFHDQIVPEVIDILDSRDFELPAVGSFWAWLHAIIKNSRRRQGSGGQSKVRTFSSLLKKLPKEHSDFVDNLYLVNISTSLSDKELWAAEAIKTAKILKNASLKRELGEISSKLKEAQEKHDEKEIAALMTKFEKVSEIMKKALS
jgi:DNA primase